MIRMLSLALLFVFVVPGLARAQEEHSEAHGAVEHGFHRNHVAVFVGASTHLNNDDTAFTFGVDYVRRLSARWGVGIVAETAMSSIERDVILVAGGTLYPTSSLVLAVGPGVEFASRDKEHGGHVETENETEFLLRLGVGYGFELASRWSLTPEFMADWTKHTWTLVYGLAIGYGF